MNPSQEAKVASRVQVIGETGSRARAIPYLEAGMLLIRR
jgi:hypothetical protein